MKYAKLINDQLILSPKSIIVNDIEIINPNQAKLIEAGYKEFVESEKLPEKSWHYQIFTYYETETQIVQQYQYVKAEQPDYDGLVAQKVAEQYSIAKEFARTNLGMQNPEDPKYIEYRDYINFCKEWAQQQINEFLETE